MLSLPRIAFDDIILTKKGDESLKLLHQMIKEHPIQYKQFIEEYFFPELALNSSLRNIGTKSVDGDEARVTAGKNLLMTLHTLLKMRKPNITNNSSINFISKKNRASTYLDLSTLGA